MSLLIIDGIRYKLWIPKNEKKDLHPLIRKCFKYIFGEDSFYFAVKHKIKATPSVASIPDAYVINLSRAELYVVEIELASHSVYDHIVKQLTKFINGIENQDSKRQIVDMLYKEINSDPVLRVIIQKAIGTTDIHYFLSELLSKMPRIVIIVDKKTDDIEKACKSLKYQPNIIEFKTFVREDAPSVQAHIFEPLYGIVGLTKIKKKERERVRQLKHNKTWDDMLAWVNNNVKELVNILSERIDEFGNVKQEISGKYLCFDRYNQRGRSRFAVFMLTKNTLKVRIKTDANTFKDPRNWTGDKIYKNFFFRKGQEREFKITNKDQISYAIELIKQSYEISM
jgi:predicted transport protein